MNIAQQIKARIASQKAFNDKSAKEHGRKLLTTLQANLQAGQTVEENEVVINRYKNVRARPLSIIQEAFARATA